MIANTHTQASVRATGRRAKAWTYMAEFVDRFSPKLSPGKHRYSAALDNQPSPTAATNTRKVS